MKQLVVQMMADRGVNIADVANLVYALQRPYDSGLTMERCRISVEAVLEKREAQHALLTGILLDTLAERGELPEPLQSIVFNDEPLFGIDEVLALTITNIYGSIGLTSFGYLDKIKLGILADLNSNDGSVHTFLDDLVAGLAAAAAARIAHNLESSDRETSRRPGVNRADIRGE